MLVLLLLQVALCYCDNVSYLVIHGQDGVQHMSWISLTESIAGMGKIIGVL